MACLSYRNVLYRHLSRSPETQTWEQYRRFAWTRGLRGIRSEHWWYAVSFTQLILLQLRYGVASLPPAPRRLRSPGPRPDGPRRRSIGHRSEQSSFRQQLFFSERQLPFCRPQRQPVKTLSVSVSTGLPNGQPFGVCRYLLLLGLLASTNGCQQPSAPVVEVARFRVGLAIARKMESSSFIVVIYCYHQCCWHLNRYLTDPTDSTDAGSRYWITVDAYVVQQHPWCHQMFGAGWIVPSP